MSRRCDFVVCACDITFSQVFLCMDEQLGIAYFPQSKLFALTLKNLSSAFIVDIPFQLYCITSAMQ